MSIWCSWPHIGTDLRDWRDEDGNPIAERGEVLSYAEGWSNHYPDLTGEAERPAAVALASIAPWCVPGHDQHGESYVCSGCGGRHDVDMGPWLRLEVAATETLNFWEKDPAGNPKVEHEGATVVLDRAAVEALRDDLSAWLSAEHVEPLKTAARVAAGNETTEAATAVGTETA